MSKAHPWRSGFVREALADWISQRDIAQRHIDILEQELQYALDNEKGEDHDSDQSR